MRAAGPGGRRGKLPGVPGPADCLLLFTKPARPGRVKTRLVGASLPGGADGTVTAARAAALHAAFLDDLAARLGRGVERGAFRLRLAWALDAAEPLPTLPEGLAGIGGVDAVRQAGDDLGARLHRALAGAARDHRSVAAVGSDHPTLPLARVEEAFAAAARGRVALGPADDGGYYLIALPAGAVSLGLFAGVAWSTGAVLEQALARCRAAGLEVELLPPGLDVDEGPDLERLAALLAGSGRPGPASSIGEGLDCPRTLALLASWGCFEAGREAAEPPRRAAAAGRG